MCQTFAFVMEHSDSSFGWTIGEGEFDRQVGPLYQTSINTESSIYKGESPDSGGFWCLFIFNFFTLF